MTIDAGLKPEGALERSPIAGAGAPSGVEAGPKRYSVQRKMAVVARLLRGEPLDVVAREANVSVAKLTEWRDRALAGAASALKEREPDGLAFHVSLLWPGAGLARVECFAHRRVSLSQGNAIACDRTSPRSDRPLSGC